MHPDPHPFLARHAGDVLGMLNGFDRLRLRGTLRRIANAQGMTTFLSQQHILFKDFGEYVHEATTRVKQATEAVATEQGRPVVYVSRPSADKEVLVRAIAARDGVTTGLVYRGEFVMTGLRNRDVRRLLSADAREVATRRRRAGQVTRQLRLLRGHGLLRKVAHTHRYLLTAKGRMVIAALLAARQADTATLAAAA